MNSIALLKVLFLSLLFVGFIPCITIGADNPADRLPIEQVRVATPKELLAAVNSKLKEMHHSLFTMDGLTIWVARQAEVSGYDGMLQPRVDSLLESLVEGKKFKYEVEVRSVEYIDIIWKTRDSKFRKIALPPHVCLQVTISNVPAGRNVDGQSFKVDRSGVIIATALQEHSQAK